MRRLAAILVLAIVMIGCSAIAADAQCAMCRTALENSPEGKGMSAAFNNGILFLLAAPYAMFGTIGFVAFRAHRRRKAARRHDNPYIRP